MIYKTDRLKERILERCGSFKEFADRLGMDKTTLSKALSNGSEWKGSNLMRAIEILEIPMEEVNTYFFTPSVGSEKERI